MTLDTAGSPAADRRGANSPEVARIFNSAYCAAVLAQCAHAHTTASAAEAGLPVLLAYLCLPLVSHADTRRAILARTSAYSVHRLVRDRPEVLAGLADRVGAFRPFTNQAILFGTANGLLRFDDAASSIAAPPGLVRRLTTAVLGDEVMESIRAASRLGTWFAARDAAEVFVHFGLAP